MKIKLPSELSIMGRGYREFKYLEHTADVKIVGYGNTIKKVFEALALGTMNIMYDIAKVDLKEERELELKSEDIISTLYDFLLENLNLFYIDMFAIGDIKVKNLKRIKVEKNKFWYIRWKVFGEKYDPNKHDRKKEVKAITYNEMSIRKVKKGLWEGKCVVDV